MRSQWKGFRRLLWGATGSVWLLCGSGLLLLPEEEFPVRISLLFMLLLSSGLSLYLFVHIHRELRKLERLAAARRAGGQRKTRRKKAGRPPSS